MQRSMQDSVSTVHAARWAVVARRVLVCLCVAASVVALLLASGCSVSPSVPAGSPATGRPAPAAPPSQQPAPTPPARAITAPAEGAYLGAYSPAAPYEMEALERFELSAGKDVSIAMWYQPWEKGNRSRLDSGTIVEVWRAGKVPLITWEPWNPGSDANRLRRPAQQPRYRLSKIVAGDYDEYIRSWANDIRDLGGPVMLRPMHEMNGNWYPWCGTVNGNQPADFVRAWRHIHDIFEEVGATNVTWVWSINHESVPGDPSNGYAAYYPGDDYVDWTAISGFNFGTTSAYSSWESFGHWYAKPLAYLSKLDKPICIAEVGCVEQGGDKARWLTEAFKAIRANRRIKAVVYYNARESDGRSTQDWRITTSPKVQSAFQAAVRPDYFVADVPPQLSEWVDELKPNEWQRLTSIVPLY